MPNIVFMIVKWNSPFNVRICGILFLCLLLFLNFLSVVRCPTLRGEFHLMNMKTVFGKFCFYNNHFSRGCMCKKRRFTYTTDVNIERRISPYDRNYVLRLVFFITTFFAGKWDLQLFSRVSGLTSCGMHLKSPYAPWFWSDWQTQTPTFS